jgi:hypothetical protein
MSDFPNVPDELWPLLDAVCDGELTPEQRSELDACLDKKLDLQEVYLDHIWLCTQVNAWSRGRRAGEAGLARVAGRLRDSAAGWEATTDETAADGAADSPRVIHPSSFILHPFAWLSGSTVSSYTFALLVLGAGLLAAWAWRAPVSGRGDSAGLLSFPEQVAQQSPQPAAPRSKPEVVAKITRMRGLKFGAWKHPDEAPADPSDVLAGCLYQMGPGAIEIVYNCGAKVVVEGPANYLVESANSGALLLGSLRATVSQARVPREPRALPTPLFVIHTRNAILEVRDAEVKVRSDASGETQTDVVSGRVTLSLPGYTDGETQVVRAGGWIHVTGVAMGERLVLCNPGEPPEVFARRLPNGAPVYSGAPGRENAPRQQQLFRSGVPDS